MKKLLYLFLTTIVFASCEEKEKPAVNGNVQFEFANAATSILKSANIVVIAKYAMVSITDKEGNAIVTNEKIEITNFNGSYISNPLSLKPGEYLLTAFFILDAEGNAIYASPKVGSPKAYLVKNPLDIAFGISSDVVTKLSPEVLSTKAAAPFDFGYATFSFTVVKTFDFLISVFVYDEAVQNYALTTATASAYANGKLLNGYALQAKTNQITILADYSEYTIEVTKASYQKYIFSISKDSLEKSGSWPINIVLKKSNLTDGLVAYYPFNGNANDESGNGNNGEVFGASLTNDRNGNANKAFAFNGTDNYINCGNSPMLKRYQTSFSISFWANINEYSSSNHAIILSNRNNNSETGLASGSIISIFGNYYLTDDVWGDVAQKFCFSLFNGNNSRFLSSDIKIETNNWIYITLTFDYKGNDQNIATLYINGILNNSVTIPDVLDCGDAPTYIGFEPIATVPDTYHFNGKLDEMRIYNRVLLKEEIDVLIQQ